MYTIKQVADIMNMSVHTLRYYSKEELFPYVKRDKNNIRYFSDEDLEWVSTVQCLRDTGMPLADIKHYVDLCTTGDSTLEERYNLIMDQKKRAEEQLNDLQAKINLLNSKAKYFKDCLDNSLPDACNPNNKNHTSTVCPHFIKKESKNG